MPHDARMKRSPLLLAVLLPLAAAAAPADNVRIYRCVGSNGAVSLQDGPCTHGRQEIREMLRPQDPPPRTAGSDRTVAPGPPSRQAPREVRHVYIQPPRPMYECVPEDGEPYLSDSNEGRPRWVPLWTTAWWPGGAGAWPGRGGEPGVRQGRPVGVGHDGRPQRPPHAPGIGMGVSVPAGNILVRDACHALPQQEVCARLRDQRWTLDRRYNSALQGEREAITREQRGIDARLDQDCAGG